MKTIINLIVSIALIAIGLYVICYIPTVIDFSQVIVRLEDNEKIYQFLIYLPLILSIFNGLLTLGNVFAKNTTLAVMNALISIGIAVWIFIDYMGSVSAIEKIGQYLNYVSYVNIGCAVLIIIEIVLDFVLNKKAIKAK